MLEIEQEYTLRVKSSWKIILFAGMWVSVCVCLVAKQSKWKVFQPLKNFRWVLGHRRYMSFQPWNIIRRFPCYKIPFKRLMAIEGLYKNTSILSTFVNYSFMNCRVYCRFRMAFRSSFFRILQKKVFKKQELKIKLLKAYGKSSVHKKSFQSLLTIEVILKEEFKARINVESQLIFKSPIEGLIEGQTF